MSYASIAAHNAPPESEQPKPDPNLLEGHTDTSDINQALPDVNSNKVYLVPSDQDLEHLRTESQEKYEQALAAAKEQRSKAEKEAKNVANAAEKKANQAADKTEKVVKNGKKEAQHLYKEGETLYEEGKKQASTAASKAEKLAKDGKKEFEKDAEILKNKSRQEAKKLKKAAREAGDEIESFWNRFSSDPKLWGPTLAAVNVALVSGVGIYAYTNRDQVQRWDKRLVSAVTVGVLGLLGGQGYWATETAKKQKGGSF